MSVALDVENQTSLRIFNCPIVIAHERLVESSVKCPQVELPTAVLPRTVQKQTLRKKGVRGEGRRKKEKKERKKEKGKRKKKGKKSVSYNFVKSQIRIWSMIQSREKTVVLFRRKWWVIFNKHIESGASIHSSQRPIKKICDHSERFSHLLPFLIEGTMEHHHMRENRDDAPASSAGLHYRGAGKEKSWLRSCRSVPSRRDTCRSTRGPVVDSCGRRKCSRK